MKRIDEKIKEIEKKDKRNRVLFIVLVAVVAAIYVYLTQQTIQEQRGTIAQQLEAEKALTKQLDDSIKVLNSSMKPDEYWNYVVEQKSTEAYIGFLTKKYGIDISAYVNPAIEKLKSDEPEGFEGWLFVGSKNNDGVYTDKNIVDVIFRQYYDGEEASLKDLEPRVGDIVQLTTKTIRNTYKNKNQTGKNELGWRNKTKAFVADVYEDPNNTNYYIKVKYY